MKWDSICTAAERGAKLTAQLLAFSRKQRLEPQVVDLNSKIMGMTNLLSVTFGGKVYLKTALASHLWPALVDPTQIELIVLNLVINARDAMDSRLLDFLGYAAVSAETQKEALQAIASELDIDLVLADVAMPAMSGVELARAIRAAWPALPVILVTGYGDLDVLKEFGESRVLQKPYTEGDLAEKINAALR
jgi:CheY-like chemotaxis protein